MVSNGGSTGSVSQGSSNNFGDDFTEPLGWRLALCPISPLFGGRGF